MIDAGSRIEFVVVVVVVVVFGRAFALSVRTSDRKSDT